VATVERRKRDHVEEEQQQIDQEAPLQTNSDHGQVTGAGEPFDGHIANEGRETHNHRVRGKLPDAAAQNQIQRQEDQAEQYVREWPCGGNEQIGAARIGHAVQADHDRLGPAKHRLPEVG